MNLEEMKATIISNLTKARVLIHDVKSEEHLKGALQLMVDGLQADIDKLE